MLNMYMGYQVDEIHECAILIFAHNSIEARNLAYNELRYMIDCEFIDTRVNRLWKNSSHLLAAADKKKYDNDEAHVIDNPPGCDNCECWGEDIIVDEGIDICTVCVEDEEHEARYNY